MNRRNFLKAAGATIFAVAAPEILLPDRTVWALDQTMLLPKKPQIIDVYEQHFVEPAEKVIDYGKWVIVRHDPAISGEPWIDVFGYRRDHPGAGFQIRLDGVLRPNEQTERSISKEIWESIRRQEYLIETMGKKMGPMPSLPGFGQSVTYDQPMPGVSLEKPTWTPWWEMS